MWILLKNKVCPLCSWQTSCFWGERMEGRVRVDWSPSLGSRCSSGTAGCLMRGHQSSVVAEHSIGHSQFAPPPLTEEFTILLNFHSNVKNLLDGILEAVEVVFNQSCEGRERTEAWLLQVTKGQTDKDSLWPIETNISRKWTKAFVVGHQVNNKGVLAMLA